MTSLKTPSLTPYLCTHKKTPPCTRYRILLTEKKKKKKKLLTAFCWLMEKTQSPYKKRKRVEILVYRGKKGGWKDFFLISTPESLSCNKTPRMVENDILSFTEISTFPVCGWHKKRSCVRAPVNVYLAHRHFFTILCCLDVDISTQMFTVFDLCLHFLGVNPRSIMNTFVLRF